MEKPGGAMSLSIQRFDEFFRELYRDDEGRPIDPFPWQTRLAKQVFDEGWPDCIDLPTASGKTAAIDIAVFVLACQAEWETNQRTVGRRIFFTVNRRIIVDEAFDRAHDLAEKLLKAEEANDAGILGEVARALRSLNEESDVTKAPPLDRVQLRGGIYRDRAWARSITQPMVICTTADQLGSRLLFRGYGVSPSSAPIQAALCGCDSLVLLDEAHVTRAFCQSMQLLMKYQHTRTDTGTSIPKLRFVQMTATPAGEVKNRFALDKTDRLHPILEKRQNAAKPATLVKLDKKKPITAEIVSRAFDALSDSRKAIGIIVNRVQTAREIERLIREEVEKRAKKDEAFEAEVHLVIGRMRPIDRDDLQVQLRTLVGPGRPAVFKPTDKPVFVVATQCLEVGANYDFDALITECASIDALRQRLGRLNRKGRPVEALAAIVTNEESLKGDDPIYGDAIKHTWEWLWSKKDANDQVDFGISSFHRLWKEVEKEFDAYLKEDCPKPLLSPTQNAAVLLPAHLDALCQTGPRPVPSPDVNYFIHGPGRDMAEVNVCWRADLGEDERHWEAIVGMLPPVSPECMTVPLHEVRQWMRNQSAATDADVAIAIQGEEPRLKPVAPPARTVVVYRGKKETVRTNDPAEIRPGDTIVVSAALDPAPQLGHIPPTNGILQLDVAERAYSTVRRLRIVRVHEAIHPELPPELKEYATSAAEGKLRKSAIRELLGELGREFSSGPDEIDYPPDDRGNPLGLLLRFNRLLPAQQPLQLPDLPEDDGEDSSIESTGEITLEKHAEDVRERAASACNLLHLARLQALFTKGADFHDLGKADIRFNAMLAGLSPFEAMERPRLLAKSGKRLLSKVEFDQCRQRAMLPTGFRHEMVSVQILEHSSKELMHESIHRDLLLHLIAAHHGHARPFAPVVIDDASDETLSIEVNGIAISPEQRQTWIPPHRLDSGVAERFWKLTREHGWWGLARLEAILRLADQQASAAEQEGKKNE
jgi:CRISPR-associated endonuclease/helicase Cas3